GAAAGGAPSAAGVDAGGSVNVGAGAAGGASSAGAGVTGGAASGDARFTGGGDVGGAASGDASFNGGSNVAGSGGDFGVQGQASSASSTVQGSASADIPNVERAAGDAQGSVDIPTGASTEAELNQTIGNDGVTVARGGAGGVAEAHVSGATGLDGSTPAADLEDVQSRASVDGAASAAVSEAGYVDPTSEAGRAQVLGSHAEGDVRVKADVVDQTHGQASAVVADPTGSASSYAETEATSAATDKATSMAPGAAAQVEVSKDTLRNPDQAAKEAGESAIDEQARDVQGSVGVDASVDSSARGPQEPKKK
nr:hypothetical protein [Deltaproteobacteria bacterium]